jgi:hypothetical protein
MNKNFNFVQLSHMVRNLQASSSTKEKEQIIHYFAHSGPGASFIRDALFCTYNPTWKYHLSSEQINKNRNLRNPNWSTNNLFELLTSLKDRKITGQDAIGAVNSFIEDGELEPYRDLILCIIDKDLKTKVGNKTINKVLPNLIPEF